MPPWLHTLLVGTWYPESGRGYAFFSSGGGPLFLLSQLALLVTMAAGLIAWYRRNECHVDSCRRIAHRQAAGTDPQGRPLALHLCRRHHPAPAPTHLQVIEAHDAAGESS